MPKFTRKEREYQVRRAEIMTAAERVFSAKGFHKATMGEIAKESEFAEGTLYNFFKSKIDLYHSLIEEKSEELLDYLRKQVSKTGGAVEKVKCLIRAQMAFFEKNRNFFKIFVRERDSFEWMAGKDVGGRVNKVYQTHIDFVARIIKDGLKHSEFRNLNPKEAAYALTGLLNSSISRWVTSPRRGRLLAQAPSLIEIFLRGVQKSRGGKSYGRRFEESV